MYINYFYAKFSNKGYRLIVLMYNPCEHQHNLLPANVKKTESVWMVPGTVED